jgi:monoamine oxidase
MSTDRQSGISRRTLIGSAAVAAVGTAVPEARASAPRRGVLRADVVVVGAGLSGLNAARHIEAAGRSAIVLEARDRVGGRTLNHSLGHGKVVEVGGQWLGPTQDQVAALARELAVGTFKTYNSGNYLFYENGKLTPYKPVGGQAIPPDPTAVGQLAQILVKLDAMAKTVPLQAPWTAPNALDWDSQTLETFKRANALGPGATSLLDLGIESVWACEPRDVSLLHVLFYIHSAGNQQTPGTFERLINTAGGAQESRFVGGSQLISIRAAKQLGQRRVLLSEPVRRIEQDSAGVTVHTDRLTVKGRRAIVTGPPSLTGRILYEPDLPALRAQLLQRFPQGSAIKIEAVYRRPFWRDQGLAGQVTSDTGPIKITFDNSPPDGRPGVLLGFVEGHDARVFGTLGAAERRAQAIASFVRYFGHQAAHPISYIEMNWSTEVWTRGCYVGFTPPGVLTDYGPWIRKPFGRIHWAGAETSDYWNGYMDGAVRSGERAAREALSGP